MWSKLLAVVAVLGLQAEAKNPVSNADMCELEQTIEGRVLLASATCCVGFARPVNYVCPVSTGTETFTKTTEHYLMDCDGELPGGVVLAKGPGDVSKALAYAKAANVAFRVKSGGHSQACLSTVKDGLVLSLESMKKVEYMHADDGSVFMTVEAGVTLTELHENYLANSNVYFPHGLDPWIGMGGHLSGGGVGHLVRKFGFGADFVVGMDVVLPSGEFVQVFEPEYEERLTGRVSVYNERDQELLWGLKGSGHANFGVVTKFWMRTIPRPEYVVLGQYSYDIVNGTSVEEFWNSVCGFYSKAPADETAEERNLLVWPTVNQNRSGVFKMSFTIYYIPDNNGTAQGALDEATPVVNTFLSHLEGLTYSTGGIQAVAQGAQFPRLVNPDPSRTALTCVSRIIPSRSDVCDRDGWIGKFADFIHDEVAAFPSRGSTFFTYFDKWGGAAALNDANFERTSVSTRNAWGTVQYCRIPFNPAARNMDGMINGEGGTKDFNDSVLAEVGKAWYINFLDALTTEPEHIYAEPAVYERLQKVKHAYDPTNVLERPLGVPLPGSEFLADDTVALVGDSAPTGADYCTLSGTLEGVVVMPGGVGCCGTSLWPTSVPCEAEAANGNESFGDSQNRVLVDCDGLQPDAVVIARSALDVTKALKFIKERDLDYRIRSGAHSQSCASTCSDCVVVSLEKMKGIDYVTSDTGATFMGVESGVVLKELIGDYQDKSDVYFPHGLDAPVGIGGHLGGGAVGYLTRKFGFGADFIVGVELVLGNGKFVQVYDVDYEEELLGYRRAHNDEDQDLLWAVKGNAHANVGVVTRYWMRTVPRPNYMVQGYYLFGAQSAVDLLSFWGSVCKFYSVEDESPKAKNLMLWPTIRSGNQLLLQVYYLPDRNDTASGALAEAEGVLTEFLGGVTAPLVAQSLNAVPDKMQFSRVMNDAGGRIAYTCTSRLVRERGDVCSNWSFLESFADRMWHELQNPVAGQGFFAYFDPWGGAATSSDPDFVKSSFMARHAWGTFQYCRTPESGDVTREDLWAAVDEFDSLIASQISDSWYVNFQDRTTKNRSQVLFVPEVTARLQAIKAKYDTTGVFSSPLTVTLPERGW